jgi:hypothetical protein
LAFKKPFEHCYSNGLQMYEYILDYKTFRGIF